MIKVFLLFSLAFVRQFAFSQDSILPLKTITVTFYNNSMLAQDFSFISYAPDETGNATNQVSLSPYAKIKRSYKVGTKLYLADKKQVAVVMSGNKLKDVPFKIITASDEGTVIDLNKNQP